MLACTEPTFHFLVDRPYTVGRRDCDILVPNDMSISRRHAVVKFFYAESDIVSRSFTLNSDSL